ncbi:MAG: hypothetical protein BIFFINMI_03496 [Phycisphaerae bacterium]|nr:hypothetical protein [Phycisphaerae bacterium]
MNEPSHPNWTPDPVVTPWDDLLAGVDTPADWATKREKVRERFLALLRMEAAPPRPHDLDVRVHEEWTDAEGFAIRRISYFVEPDERAHAYLAIPAGDAPPGGRPAVLCIHGTTNWGARQTLGLPPSADEPEPGNGRIDGKDFARLLARAGYVTLSPEHFCCATRRPKTARAYDTAEFYARHPNWSACGKSTFENRIALDVLCGLPEVDAGRIGATGHSLGGHNTIFLAAVDDRVRAAFPHCAGLTINQNPAPLHWSRDHWYVYFPQLRPRLLAGERVECDFHEMMALIAPRPLLEVFAINDTDFAAQSQRVGLHVNLAELYRLLDAQANHAFFVFGDGHAMTAQTRALLVSWMDRHLKHAGDKLGPAGG